MSKFARFQCVSPFAGLRPTSEFMELENFHLLPPIWNIVWKYCGVNVDGKYMLEDGNSVVNMSMGSHGQTYLITKYLVICIDCLGAHRIIHSDFDILSGVSAMSGIHCFLTETAGLYTVKFINDDGKMLGKFKGPQYQADKIVVEHRADGKIEFHVPVDNRFDDTGIYDVTVLSETFLVNPSLLTVRMIGSTYDVINMGRNGIVMTLKHGSDITANGELRISNNEVVTDSAVTTLSDVIGMINSKCSPLIIPDGKSNIVYFAGDGGFIKLVYDPALKKYIILTGTHRGNADGRSFNIVSFDVNDDNTIVYVLDNGQVYIWKLSLAPVMVSDAHATDVIFHGKTQLVVCYRGLICVHTQMITYR